MDNDWSDIVAALLVVHPIQADEEEDDYIAVVLNAKLRHHKMCANALDKGVEFANGFADDEEDVLLTFMTIEAVRDQMNKKQAEAIVEKPIK